jgi:hypothetical protein
MVWSGWQLWRGEQVPAAWTVLPREADWAIHAGEPATVADALRVVAELPQVPADWRAIVRAEQKRWLARTAATGAGRGQPWTLAAVRGHWWLAVPALQAQQPATGAFPLPGAHTALDAFVQPPRDATATLAQQHFFREGLERAGGGQLQAWIACDPLKAWAQGLTDPVVREFLVSASWAAAALKVDGTHARLHVHVGTGQRGAVFLKQHLDPVRELDAATVLDSAATARGVARLNPQAWDEMRGRHPLVHLLDLWHKAHPEFDLSDAITGQMAWQSFSGRADERGTLTVQLLHNHATDPALQRHCQQATPPVCRHAPGWLVVAPDAESADRALQVATGVRANLRQAGGLDGDEERLMTATQGLRLLAGARVEVPGLQGWTGPMQVEALWLDTGLIAEVAIGLR